MTSVTLEDTTGMSFTLPPFLYPPIYSEGSSNFPEQIGGGECGLQRGDPFAQVGYGLDVSHRLEAMYACGFTKATKSLAIQCQIRIMSCARTKFVLKLQNNPIFEILQNSQYLSILFCRKLLPPGYLVMQFIPPYGNILKYIWPTQNTFLEF